MPQNNKNLLALKSLLFGLKAIFTQPITSLVDLWDWAITPLANEQLARQNTIPVELKKAYYRDWTFETLSDVRRQAGKKGLANRWQNQN